MGNFPCTFPTVTAAAPSWRPPLLSSVRTLVDGRRGLTWWIGCELLCRWPGGGWPPRARYPFCIRSNRAEPLGAGRPWCRPFIVGGHRCGCCPRDPARRNGGIEQRTGSTPFASGVVAIPVEALSGSFLDASWPVQHAERAGQLQELLTTFTQQGAVLINNLALAVTSTFSLLSLLVLAVAISPVGAVVIIISLIVLGALLRPIRRVVKRRGAHQAKVGMRLATSLNEISQLGMEVHIFHVQNPTKRLVGGLIEETAESERRLNFARMVSPSLYTGLGYLALIAAIGGVAASEPGDLTSLGAVLLIMLRSLTYGQSLQMASTTINSTLPFLDSLHERLAYYRAGRQRDEGGSVGHIIEVKIDAMTFSYDAGTPVLKDLSVSIGEREVIGIIGPSGGGKSTLVQLLLGLREPDSGVISVQRPTDLRVCEG